MPTSSRRIILGIDPGLADTGFGVLEQTGHRFRALDYGSIKTKPTLEAGQRLKIIYEAVHQLVRQYRPDAVGVEKLFFAKNAKTAMAVGQARGVIMMGLAEFGLEVSEFTPMQVKIALTGYGKASKLQIQQMVKSMLKLKTIPKPDDAADALAIAVCCAHTKK